MKEGIVLSTGKSTILNCDCKIEFVNSHAYKVIEFCMSPVKLKNLEVSASAVV